MPSVFLWFIPKQALSDQFAKFGAPPIEQSSPENARNLPTLKNAAQEMIAENSAVRSLTLGQCTLFHSSHLLEAEGAMYIRSAFMLGAGRVIAIDRVPERLQMAKDGGAEILNFEEVEVGEALKEMTGGRGPDSVMDAVGMEAHGMGLEGFYDKAKQAVRLETDRPNVLRQAIVACRKGGTVSVPGVYTGFVDKMPMGAFMNKGLTMKTGQTHVHKYLRPLVDRVQKGEIDPSFVITHRLPLEQAPHGYEIFKHKKDNCIKIVLKP